MVVLFGCGQGVVFVPEIDSGKLAPMSIRCKSAALNASLYSIRCRPAALDVSAALDAKRSLQH